MRSPASVRATLRVVRFKSRTPRCSSRARIVWLRDALDIPNRFAALVELVSSATATNALSSANCVPRIILLLRENAFRYSLTTDMRAFFDYRTLHQKHDERYGENHDCEEPETVKVGQCRCLLLAQVL